MTKEIIDYVQEYMRANDISKYNIYTSGGVKKGVVNRFFKGEPCTMNTVESILDYVGLKLSIKDKNDNRTVEDKNFGLMNLGKDNKGNDNVGDGNNGNENIGDYNFGNKNFGHYNVGNFNFGNNNQGHFNCGEFNKGSFNHCSYSNGFFNTMPSNDFRIFNKPMKSGMNEMNVLMRLLLKNIEIVLKTSDPDYSYREYWQIVLEGIDPIIIRSLPYFDSEVFRIITGVRI